MTNNPIAVLGVLVTNLVTNWTDSGYESRTLLWPPEANKTTHYENGEVFEVVSLQLQYDGKTHINELTRRLVATGSRSYWYETTRHSGLETWKSAPVFVNSTNVEWSVCTATNIQLLSVEYKLVTNVNGSIWMVVKTNK